MKLFYLAFFTSIIFAFLLMANVLASAAVIQPSSADARVEESNSNGNFGNRVDLKVRSAPPDASSLDMRTFIKFNLSSIPSEAVINSAKLKLFKNDAFGGSNRNYEIRRVTENWNESVITWTNQPSVSANITHVAGINTSDNVWDIWDVTSDIINFYSGNVSNFGWRINDADENSSVSRESNYRSRDYSTNLSLRPMLEVEYTLSSKIECAPHSLFIGSSLNWINCFIEMDNANVSDINLSTVKMNVVGKAGSVFADSAFFKLNDFDFDGKPDLQVRFSKHLLNDTFFSDVNSTTFFSLEISGRAGDLDFSGMDNLLLIETPEGIFVNFAENNTISKSSKINKLPLIDLQKFEVDSISFSGYFSNRNNSTFNGLSRIYVKGNQIVEKNIQIGSLNFTLTEIQPIVGVVFVSKYDDCSAANSTNVNCEGSGFILLENKKTREEFKMSLTKIQIEIKNGKGRVEGGEFWNDIFSVTDIPIETIKVLKS